MNTFYIFGVLIPLFIMTIFMIIWFIRRYRNEKRSLWFGISFLAAFFSFWGLMAAAMLVFFDVAIIQWIAIIGAFIVLAAFLLFPFTLIAFMLISGVQLIRKEGFSLSHLLSFGFGVACIAYLVIWPILNNISTGDFFSFLYSWISFCLFFTAFIFGLYTITNMLNLPRSRRKKYNYIIVLGCGLRNGNEVTPLLAGRVDKGIQAHRQNPGSRLVLSGGKGADESIAEAMAMKNYALQKGVKEADVLVEDKSVSTRENLLFSERLIREGEEADTGNWLVVTNNYHVLRALLLAKNLGIACDGRGSRTKMYFALNAFIREWIAYLSFWRKKYIIVLAGSFVVIGMLYLLIHFLGQ